MLLCCYIVAAEGEFGGAAVIAEMSSGCVQVGQRFRWAMRKGGHLVGRYVCTHIPLIYLPCCPNQKLLLFLSHP